MAPKKPKILVVDDERNVLNAVRRCLRGISAEIETFSDPVEAASAVRDRPDGFAAIVADHRMPGMTGLELLRRVKEIAPDTVRILFTAYTEMDVVVRAINEGEVFRFIRKPWEDAELVGVVLSALSHHELILENARLLATVRRQQETLEELERLNPGLTRLPPQDEDGAFIIEPPDGEFSSAW